MRQTTQRRTVLLTLLIASVTVGGTVSLAAATSTSPSLAQTTSQANFSAAVETYNGEVALEDGAVTVAGSASTNGEIVVVFVGSRGAVVASELPVTGDQFGATIGLDEVGEGFVDGVVLSSGSDETFGTPGEGPDTGDDLVGYATDLTERDLTQDQIREVLLEVTVDGSGSDDRLVDVPFVLTQGDIQIDDVVPARAEQASGIQPIPVGDTMLVRGVTNRKPSGVLVEVTAEGPNGTQLDPVTVDDWETDGVWSAELSVPSDAPVGTYTVLADGGDQSDSADVELVEAGTATATATATPDTTSDETPSTATPTPSQTTEATQTDDDASTPEPTPEPTTTETQSPGFGVLTVLAGVAIVTLALAGFQRRRL